MAVVEGGGGDEKRRTSCVVHPHMDRISGIGNQRRYEDQKHETVIFGKRLFSDLIGGVLRARDQYIFPSLECLCFRRGIYKAYLVMRHELRRSVVPGIIVCGCICLRFVYYLHRPPYPRAIRQSVRLSHTQRKRNVCVCACAFLLRSLFPGAAGTTTAVSYGLHMVVSHQQRRGGFANIVEIDTLLNCCHLGIPCQGIPQE